MKTERGRLTIQHSVDYSVLLPDSEGPHPVLIALHGWGQAAAEFAPLFEPLAERGVLVGVPQAPHHFYVSMRERKVGFSWLTRYERDRSVAEFVAYMEQFFEVLVRDHGGEGAGVVFLGFSQGVSMAYRAWVHSRLPVKGIVACGADLPPDVADLLADRPPVPVLLVHGSKDESVPIRKARSAHQVLSAHGVPVEMLEFEGGHVVPSEAIRRIGRIMLEE